MSSIYFFAWAASILYAMETIVAKLISKHAIKNPWLLNFLWTFITLVFIVPIALANGAGVPAQWTAILFTSLILAASGVMFVITLSHFDVTVMAPMFSFRSAFAVLLGTLFLGEILTYRQYFLIIVIVVGGLFVSVNEKMKLRSFFNKNILLLLVYMLVLALSGVMTKVAVAATDYWTATLWILLLAQVWILPTIVFFKNDLGMVSRLSVGSVLAVAVVDVGGTLTALKAYSLNESLAAVIISLPISMVIAFLFSVFAPQLLEKHAPQIYTIRFAAAAVMIGAALYLAH